MSTRVLFVGASGHVGARVVPLLAEKFDLELTGLQPGEIAGKPVQPLDITDWEATEKMVREAKERGATALVNCAIQSWKAAPKRSAQMSKQEAARLYGEAMIEVNVRGAYHIYESAARAGLEKVVYISSMTIALGKPTLKSISGLEAPRPRDFYACTKLFGENTGHYYAHHRKLQVLCLRLGQPYPIEIPKEDGWKDDVKWRGLMVHIEDVAQSIECALRAKTPCFGSYSILSDSDVESRFASTAPAREIGYLPRRRFTQNGVFDAKENQTF